MRLRRQLLVVVFLILVCAIANFVAAILATRFDSVRIPNTVNLRSAQAAAAGWPEPAPSDWPSVSAWSEWHAPAFRARQAWGWDDAGSTTHSQLEQEFGWPLPVLSRTRFWWPGLGQPAATLPHDSGLRFEWSGCVLNPLLAASALWLVLIGPFLLRAWWQVRSRRRRGQCQSCAYPLGASGICPECGGVAPVHAS